MSQSIRFTSMRSVRSMRSSTWSALQFVLTVSDSIASSVLRYTLAVAWSRWPTVVFQFRPGSCRLLKGVPFYSTDIKELLTPRCCDHRHVQ